MRTRREVTETTTEEDEDREVVFDDDVGGDAETKGETDSDERGRTLNRKTVTTTVRVGLGRPPLRPEPTCDFHHEQ